MTPEDFDIDEVLADNDAITPVDNTPPDPDEISIDDVVATPAAPATPAATTAVATVAPAGSLKKRTDFDEADKKLMSVPGVTVMTMGEHVTRFPVDRIKFSASKKSNIAIIGPNPIAFRLHYNDVLHGFLCFEGACCEHEGLPKIRYVFPVFVYDTDSKGKLISETLDLKILVLGDDAYEALVTIYSVLQDRDTPVGLNTVDLLVTCTDEGYQKVTFTEAGRNRWRSFKDPGSKKMIQDLVQKWKDNKPTIYRPVAKKLSTAEYLKQMDIVGEVADGSSLDLDDVLN